MSSEKPDQEPAHGSAAGESRCDYFGLLRDTLQAYFDTDYSLTAEELLADILIANMAEGDREEAPTFDVPQCPDSSDSEEEEFPPGCVTPRMSTLDPKQCGGSFRGHLDMLCDCCHHPHAAAARGVDEADQQPASPDDGSNLPEVYTQGELVAAAAATVDVDVEIAVNAMGFNEIAHDLKEAIEEMDLEDAVTEMALDMDAAPATADIDEFLNAFDEIACDLKDFIEAMDREDAMTAMAMDMDAENAALATVDMDEVLDALGFNDITRDLKDFIEAMDPKDA
uniref:Uncharacterized protein n=1 Tax=Oryza brachyantha TaxID=4533 RepID=J3LEW2_ORYBR